MAGLTVLLVGLVWALGVWVRKAVPHFKQVLTGCPTRNMEDSGAERDLTFEDPSSEGFCCYILAKDVAAFCPCTKKSV